jgi:glutamine synthetase
MPDYFLVTGVDNRPYGDLDVTGYHTGFNNGVLRPLTATRFTLPTEPDTAFFLADAVRADGTPYAEAVRNILARQIARLAAHGLTASVASELEFYLYRTSYAEAFAGDYRTLTPFYHRHADNDILNAGFAEPFLAAVRAAMAANGIACEATQGEGGIGQYEINIRHAEPLAMADSHVLFKHVVKAIAQERGLAATFMAKPAESEAGSGGHVHLSLYDGSGAPALGADGTLGALGRAFLAGLLSYTPELTLLHAPFVNSYRRLQPGSFAPANVCWSGDNRTAMVRVLGGAVTRFELRLPGADMNPYLSFAAILAAGLAGIDRQLAPPPPIAGSAYGQDLPTVPGDLGEAIALFADSALAAEAFTPAVHKHLVALACKERDEHRRAVTGWQLRRYFDTA